ncbi:MAG: serine hydrolase domain-containing protein [Actinomycetota bacterium]
MARVSRADGREARRLPFVLILLLAIATACSSRAPSPRAVPWPTKAWATATPESQGFDSLKVAAALESTGGYMHSFLAIRNGSVVTDAYVYPYDGSIYHDLASVTKSFTTTLIGIAATQGKLDLDASMVSFFPGRTIANRDERKEGITVRHLLSMSSGLNCRMIRGNEITLQEMRQSSDWVQFALDLPALDEPGTAFSYCSPGMHLLSAILQQATGMSELDYARANLFAPLGITDVYWPADPQGVTFGWGDLALHPRDAAKLGYLYLNDGVWDGRRILSHVWVSQATSPKVKEDYGYGFWVSRPSDEIQFFRADGNQGQRILVVPSRNLVLVTTGAGFEPDQIFRSVAQAASADLTPLPANPAGVARLQAVIAQLARGPEPEPVASLPQIARAVSGRTYAFKSTNLVRTVRLDFGNSSEATFTVDVAGELTPRVDRVGLDGVFRSSRKGRPIYARASWEDPGTFVVECDEGPGLHSYRIRLAFGEDSVRLELEGASVAGSWEGRLVSP